MDWDAAQYLKFGDERTRAARDLLAQVPISSPKQIFDLGCGPGNSTELLQAAFPQAQITGADSSEQMLAEARTRLPQLSFKKADLNEFVPETAADLYFANAVFQWLPNPIAVMQRLISSLAPGGVLAAQMPDNFEEPSHRLMREIAGQSAFSAKLGAVGATRTAIEKPGTYYDHLAPLCARIDIWHVVYNHVLASADGIIEWVSGTGLRPYLSQLDKAETGDFLEAYGEALAGAYPRQADGKVLFRFPRLFIVAVKA